MDALAGGAHRAELCLHPAGSDARLWPRLAPARAWGRRGCFPGAGLAAGALAVSTRRELAQGAVWMRDAGAVEGLNALYGVYGAESSGGHRDPAGLFTAAAGELEIRVRGGRPWCPSPSVGGCCSAGSSGDHRASADHRPPLDALQPVVISFGKVEGGRAFNVIADQVRLLGTVRCLDLQQHAQLPDWIDETVQRICASGGGAAVVNYRCIAPLHNDPQLTTLLERCAVGVWAATRFSP